MSIDPPQLYFHCKEYNKLVSLQSLTTQCGDNFVNLQPGTYIKHHAHCLHDHVFSLPPPLKIQCPQCSTFVSNTPEVCSQYRLEHENHNPRTNLRPVQFLKIHALIQITLIFDFLMMFTF
jgi:hypothetical protein